MLRSADKESDFARARTRVPGLSGRTVIRSARASHVVLCLDEPALGLNLRRLVFVTLSNK